MSKKRAKSIYISVLMLLLVLPFVFAQNQTAIDKGYSCLTTEVNSRISTLTSEELSFSLLALSYNSSMSSLLRSELLKKNQSNCWPAGNCRLRDTALAAIALKNINEDTATFTNWLSSQNSTPSNLIWYLQIDPNNATDCTLTYDGSSYATSVKDDKKLSSGAGSCLPLDTSGYWLQIVPSCQNKEFSISCKSDFKTTLLYEKDKTIYVSDKTSSAPKEGTTKEKISILCFAQGGVCNYEGSTWAAYALKKAGQNIDAFTPYLIAFSSDNQEILPEAFLYLLLGRTDYKTSVSSKQSTKGYWDTGNVQYNVFYDTALALLSLAQRITSAENYLLDPAVQGGSGCWNSNNVRDTAFILNSAFSKTIPLFSIIINPSSVTIMPNETIQFTASITGTASTAVIWNVQESSGGTINETTGFYIAPSAIGTYHVTAALQSNTSKNATASIIVSLTPAIVISISPSSITLRPNATQQFTASVTGTSNKSVIWNVQESNGGTINETTGFYRAPNATGTFNVKAVLQSNSSISSTASVVVSLPPVPVYCEEEGGYCLGITQTQCTNANASVLSDFICSSGKVCCSANVSVDKTCSQLGGQKCSSGKTCPSDNTLIAKDAAYGICCEKSSYCITSPQTCSQLNGELCSSGETCPVSQIFNASNVNYGRCCKKNECVASGQKTCSQLGGRKCAGGKVCSETEINGASDVQSSESCCSGTCVISANDCEKKGYSCKSSCIEDEEEASQYTDACASGKICCKSKTEAGKFPWFIVILSVLIILVVLGILFRDKLRLLFFRFGGKGRTGPAPPQTRPPFPPMPPRIMQPRMILRPTQPTIPTSRQPMRSASSQTDKELEDTFKKLREMSK